MESFRPRRLHHGAFTKCPKCLVIVGLRLAQPGANPPLTPPAFAEGYGGTRQRGEFPWTFSVPAYGNSLHLLPSWEGNSLGLFGRLPMGTSGASIFSPPWRGRGWVPLAPQRVTYPRESAMGLTLTPHTYSPHLLAHTYSTKRFDYAVRLSVTD